MSSIYWHWQEAEEIWMRLWCLQPMDMLPFIVNACSQWIHPTWNIAFFTSLKQYSVVQTITMNGVEEVPTMNNT